MSYDLSVYLSRAAMPAPAAWAGAIRDLGFPLTLDADFDVDEHAGFVPCRHGSADSGFEYYADTLSVDGRVELELPPTLDFTVTFTTHADTTEAMTATICAAVLCHLARGRLLDPQSGEEVEAAAVLDWARRSLRAAAADGWSP